VTLAPPTPVAVDTGRPDPLEGLRVIRLQAENFKRLVAVDITPSGDVVVVSGANGQGKSSVLDAIWAVCCNAQAARTIPDPIRHGADTARVQLDLGDLVVTRTWTGKGTRLTVESPTGARYRSPQTVLDTLLGRLSFDPVAFLGMREAEQVAELLAVLDLDEDPAELDQRRADLYEQRTEVNRDVKRLAAVLDGMPDDPDAPESEVTIAEALARLDAARAVVDEHRQWEQRAEELSARMTALDAQIQSLTEERDRAAREHFNILQILDAGDEALPDLDALTAEVSDIEARNARARAVADRRRVAAEHADVAARSQQLTDDIRCLDETRRTLLAEARMPLPGLAFADDGTGLTYQGVPLAQCCSSERLKVSVAVAMAANPRMRVIRVTDGSLLDGDSMRLLEAMAAEHGCQVWVERVDESGSVGIVIEDGTVATAAGDAR